MGRVRLPLITVIVIVGSSFAGFLVGEAIKALLRPDEIAELNRELDKSLDELRAQRHLHIGP